MTQSPNKVPWLVVLAVAIAAAAVWEQRAMKKTAPAPAPVAQKPLPPPAPTLEALAPQKGQAFEPKAPIEHAWTALPGDAGYQLDFAVPQPDGGCHFDAPRMVAEAHATSSHDEPAPCMVWRVRAQGQVAGGSYTVGPPPGCTLPPSMMVLCLEQP